MLDTLVVDDRKFKIDPETNFWGTGDLPKLEKLYNKMREKLVAEIKDFRFSSDIILFYVNPTDKCNASCPYCYLPQRVKNRSKSMSYSELEVIVKKASEFFNSGGKKGSIIFHGSEPLLNKENLFKIIEDYDELHFGIQTNGFLLSEEDAEFIKDHRVNIGISLDSPVEKTNDYLRGKGQYKKIMDALGWFRNYKGLNVVTTITTHNVDQLSEMVRLLHEKDVSLCLMNPVRGTQRGALALRPEPLKLASEFIKAVDEAIKLTKEGRRIVVADFANILLGIIAPSARVMMCDISPCGGGRRFFAITANGNAYPCGEFIGMEEFVGGNIFTDPVEDIAASENFLEVTQRTVERIQECRACLFRNMCGAPCPAEIYSTEGSMLSKSYYCEFYKKVAEHAFRIINRDDVEHVIRKSALREMYNLEKEG
jgi:uncharacterized protein